MKASQLEFESFSASTKSGSMLEQRENLSEDSPVQSFPLFVRHCGRSEWSAGSFLLRRKSRIFAVEMVIAGSVRFIQNGHEYTVGQGECFLLHKGSFHVYNAISSVSKLYIGFSGDMLDVILNRFNLNDKDVITLIQNEKQFIIAKTNQILSLFKRKKAGYEYLLSTLAYEILLRLGKSAERSNIKTPIAACIQHLRQNMDLKPDISVLQDIAGVSRRALYRMFKESLGQAPMGVLLKIRMRQAAGLLKFSRKPIKEIARSVGYSDPAYFCNVFKKSMRISPREFVKRNHRNDLIETPLAD